MNKFYYTDGLFFPIIVNTCNVRFNAYHHSVFRAYTCFWQHHPSKLLLEKDKYIKNNDDFYHFTFTFLPLADMSH